ncbi:MAG TPA: hypothetical protein VK973_06900 [Arenicellales bacterium]|nr:hypothetical protein [Arenicellales bacterium]
MKYAIVYVPGKSPKPRPEVHREQLWRSLRRGVLRHDPGLEGQLQHCRFSLVAWNFEYYHEFENLDADIPWIDRLLAGEGASDVDVREARHWSKWATRLLYSIGDHAHWLIRILPDRRIKAMIEDTLRYFENTEGIADRIRHMVKDEIEAASDECDSVCVISHSMGSVIAYESLWSLTHEEHRPAAIDLFLTLGSPLGMNYVQKRLLGLRDGSGRYPQGIREWVNVSAVGDLVSVDQRVENDFTPMVKQGGAGRIRDIHHDIYTAFRNEQGLNPHRSYGYLAHPEVGAVIGEWLRGAS